MAYLELPFLALISTVLITGCSSESSRETSSQGDKVNAQEIKAQTSKAAEVAPFRTNYLTVMTAPQPDSSLFRRNDMDLDVTAMPYYAEGLGSVMRFNQVLPYGETPPYVQPIHRGEIIARDGCVLIGTQDVYHLAVLPAGVTLTRDSEGYASYLNSKGNMVARLGTRITFSGGGPRNSVDVEREATCGVTSSIGLPELKSVPHPKSVVISNPSVLMPKGQCKVVQGVPPVGLGHVDHYDYFSINLTYTLNALGCDHEGPSNQVCQLEGGGIVTWMKDGNRKHIEAKGGDVDIIVSGDGVRCD